MRANDLPLARWIALLLPLTLIAGALASQYLGGLCPCEMCHWQRWPHYAAIGLAALSFVVPRTSGKRALVILAGIAILVSGAIGVFHAGVEYHWWQGITACANTLGATGGDLLAAIVRQPVVRCDVPQWTLFGISLAGFNAILSITGALAVLILATRRRT
ncbi:disulfide bond formation protein B [Sphingomonas hankookensis]|uniref:disulfide bond formation protein B n=1 Tax=Sphingomonas hankookensis TaxID=563996 RepID=UPI00234EB1D4|nr:disulfide bond formation protein B [Sphingomonas hankookensis]WCP72274.1 disulfide bond formation protein B [Sphingomonas hankookensis]